MQERVVIETKLDIIRSTDEFSHEKRNRLIDFLYKNLEEFTDSKEHIAKAIDHIFSADSPEGGFIVLTHQYLDLSGAVVINRTGMDGYIPENILVYIAVRKDLRGKGIGKYLIEKVHSIAQGDIALHVEPHNPAKHLYERLGFENKYLEMRWVKK